MTIFLYDKETNEVKQVYANVLSYESNKIVYINTDDDGNETTFYASCFADNIEFAVGDDFETAEKGCRHST
jgi:hypothetical protein